MAERGLAYGPAFQVLTNCIAAWTMRWPRVRAAGVGRPRSGPLSSASGAGRCAVASRWPARCRSKRTARSARSRTCRSAFAAFACCRTIEDYHAAAVRVRACARASESSPSPERVEGRRLSGERRTARCWWRSKACRCSGLGRSGAADSTSTPAAGCTEIAWREEPLGGEVDDQRSTASPASAWLIFADAQGVGRKLADQLGAARQVVHSG